MTITSLYAALAALFFVFLSFRVIRIRRSERIALGDGGNRALLRAMRLQGNFAEYAPMVLLLMALAEFQGASGWALHPIGLTLLAGRTVHSLGFGREPERFRLRTAGMVLTFVAIISGALANLALTLPRIL